MSKIDFPKLTTELTSPIIHVWLGCCKDTVEAWQAMNPNKSLAARMIITLAGLRMEEPTAATWWNENRDEVKKLASWDEFAQKVKDHFVPSNWRMTGLAAFYAIHQGPSHFADFAKALQQARNSLASAGAGFTISDSMLKNHLLFHAHPILRLHVTGQQVFPYASMKVDALIANMSSVWDSLLAEKVVRLPVPGMPSPLTIPPAATVASPSSSLPTPPASASSTPSQLPPLMHAEREALRAVNGCFHCRKTPQTPGWVKYRSDTCPGDAALGIPPRNLLSVVAAVGPVGFSADYKEGYAPVAAVMPVYDNEEDSFSSATDDSDLSQRN
ncbi:hypothetical protein B0H17DRAFT_1208869 [Mycena rosella]|uniref:Uncharacterized protein n=1 Tax=Mycena rosella TaxID=1033263 RepID=A0AAD7G955_MYCRO|nr:hypothetical protein B0H17DRAFT_1208869 [Mycena rosella]